MNTTEEALRACVVCGQPFTGRYRKDRRFCEGKCRTSAYEKRHRRGPPPPPSLEERAAAARLIVNHLEAELGARRAELRALDEEIAQELAARQVHLPLAEEETRSERIGRVYGVASRDLWRTPPEVFAFLQAQYPYTLWVLDAAALPDDSLCPAHIGPGLGGLEACWDYMASVELERQHPAHTDYEHAGVWCNPPYSPKAGGIAAWVEKAIEEREIGVTVAMLLPADTSTEWYRRTMATASYIYLLPRLAHLHPDTGLPVKGSRFGSALIVWGGFVGPARVTSVASLTASREALEAQRT